MRESGNVNHPGVGVTFVEKVITPGGHHADAAGAADAIVETAEIHGSKPAAGQTGEADPCLVNIFTRAEVIEGRGPRR